jgi:hypothetical protein
MQQRFVVEAGKDRDRRPWLEPEAIKLYRQHRPEPAQLVKDRRRLSGIGTACHRLGLLE